MKQLKHHSSLQEQVALLGKRGLEIDDSLAVEDTLARINYYRLSGYLHDFKLPGTDRYCKNLCWEKIKSIYDFDKKFTRILLFALEDIEETLKTRLSYTVTSHYPTDPVVYLKPEIYKEYDPYLRFLYHFFTAKENNMSIPFIDHHNKNYGGFLPMWVAVEILTMGNLHALYDNLETSLQKQIAKLYQTGPRQLSNWIENLTYTRNHLAHYMRIYNYNFGRTPKACKRHPRNFTPTNMIFDQIYIMFCMYSDKEEWNSYVVPELKSLVEDYGDYVELRGLGFPTDWDKLLGSR